MNVDEIVARGLEPMRKEIQRVRDIHAEVSRSEIDCANRDGSIKITQTLGGEILSIKIRSGTFDRHDEASLADALAELLRSARHAARDGARQLAAQIRHERG